MIIAHSIIFFCILFKGVDDDWEYVVNGSIGSFDPHHDYYLLLDDGTPSSPENNNNQSRLKNLVGKAREKLEADLAKERPTALLLFGGRYDELKRVLMAINPSPQSIPCIVVKGSGGAADALVALKEDNVNAIPLGQLVDPGFTVDWFNTKIQKHLKFIHVVNLEEDDIQEKDANNDNDSSGNDEKITTSSDHKTLCDILLKHRIVDLPTMKMAGQLGSTAWVKEGLQQILAGQRLVVPVKISSGKDEVDNITNNDVHNVADLLKSLFLSKDPEALKSVEVVFNGIPQKKLDLVIEKVIGGSKLSKFYQQDHFPSFIRDRIAAFSKKSCFSSKDQIFRLQVHFTGYMLFHKKLRT